MARRKKTIPLPQLSQPQILLTDNTFNLKAETFRMKVNYSQGLPLSVFVEDLVQFVRYSQEFHGMCQWKIKGQAQSEGQAKGQVLCQNEITNDDRIYTCFKQVYESLLNAGKSDDKQSDQEYQGVNNYHHDEIVHKENVPCFKLQTGGKLTVYFNIIKQRNKKEYCFETVLNLSKSADMTSQQIVEQKMAKNNKQIMEMKKIIQKQSEELKENSRLIEQQRLDIQQKTKKIDQKNQQINQQGQQIQQQTQQIQTLTNNNSNTFLQKYKPFNTYIINHICGNGTWIGYPINKAIPQDRASIFKIKIIKKANLSIGIVDSLKYSSNLQDVCSCDYAIIYHHDGCNKGYKYPGNVEEGTGFVEGETVLVTVDPVNKYVTWSVNNAVRATVNYDMLADANRVFVPYVQMYHNGTQVQWIQ